MPTAGPDLDDSPVTTDCPPGFRLRRVVNLPPEELERLEKLAFQYGGNFLSYALLEPDREVLLTEDWSAVVAFVRQGRFLHVTGGVLGAPLLAREVARALVRYAQQTGHTICCSWMTQRELEPFADFPFQVSRCGVEHTVRFFPGFGQGKNFAWVRREVNFARRQGIQVIQHSSAIAGGLSCSGYGDPVLQQIAAEHLRGRFFSHELLVFEPQPLRCHIVRRRFYLAIDQSAPPRVVGFLTCTPGSGGRKWCIEFWRAGQHAPRGTIAALVMHTLQQLRSEQVEEVSLGPVPGPGSSGELAGESKLIRWLVWVWPRFLERVYSTKGLRQFKQHFRPQTELTYTAVYPRASLRLLISLAIVSRAWWGNPLALWPRKWHWW